jgi:hypothetical protein
MDMKELTPEILEQLQARTIEITDKAQGKKKELSEKANQIKKIIVDGGFECRTKTVLNLFSVLLEEDITSYSEYPQGSMVVPINDNHSRSYTLFEPVIVYSQSDGFRPIEGPYIFTLGDTLSLNSEDVRFATTEEIKSYFDKIKTFIVQAKNIKLNAQCGSRIKEIAPDIFNQEN